MSSSQIVSDHDCSNLFIWQVRRLCLREFEIPLPSNMYANQPACLPSGLKQAGWFNHFRRQHSDRFHFFFLGHVGRRAFGNGWRKENANWAEDVPGTGNQKTGKSCSRPHSQQKQEQSTETYVWIQEQSSHIICWLTLLQSTLITLISQTSLSRVEKWWWFRLRDAGSPPCRWERQLFTGHGIFNWFFPLSHLYFLCS